MNCIYYKKGLLAITRRYISSFKWNVIFTSSQDIWDLNVFNRWKGPTADEVSTGVDLSDKVALVTGANSGIGYEISRCLHSRGSEVLMICRNLYAANRAAQNISIEDDGRLHAFECDLASLRSVKKCAETIVQKKKNIDIVILNAGVFGIPWSLTEDGVETTFQVNFLSQYYLLMLIEKILAPQARVVFMSSESHRNMTWSTEQRMNPTFDMVSLPQREFTGIRAYNRSKTCCLLAMHYLGYKWLYTDKSVFCVHPGSFVKTGLCRNWHQYEILYTIMKPFAKTVAQAAATPVYCATSPQLSSVSGLYYKDCKHTAESELAQDMHLAFRMRDLIHSVINERIPDSGLMDALPALPQTQLTDKDHQHALTTCST